VDKTTKTEKLIDMVASDPALSREFRAALTRPELPVDPVSGLRPLFVPSTPPPPGAVYLLHNPPYDFYWIPDGTFAFVSSNGAVTPNQRPFRDGCVVPAARALSLPLREPGGMDDGEEAWTDERLDEARRAQFRLNNWHPSNSIPHCAGAKDVGLSNLRRWGNAAHGGWVCRKLDARPGPGRATTVISEGEAYAYATQCRDERDQANRLLSARDARIAGLEEEVKKMRDIIERNAGVCKTCSSVKRLESEIAAIEGHLKGHYTFIDQWLARNGGA
jgi:hypothetical protein